MALSSRQFSGAAQVLQQKALAQQAGRVVFHAAQHLLHGLAVLGIELVLGGPGPRTGLITQQVGEARLGRMWSVEFGMRDRGVAARRLFGFRGLGGVGPF
jgi:hypothetical protein